MSNVTFFILALLLMSNVVAKARPISTNTRLESNPQAPFSSTGIEASRKESGMDDDGCEEATEREEILIRRSMVAHTDYIYTQDINGP
ncbi:hypothetical protein Tsubulata_026230 [Turnera subulata]|uniref:Phytosulfokine n=1 Tax=Turnera subulata TaxID=218843 RepID=A0A9Q0JN14_9ROSI|nr:hypothetical protein Tsubulata_026230 [Turnera subulata]